MNEITYWQPGAPCCNPQWENAYLKFETSREEKKKFRKRFKHLGIDKLQRDLKIVELFCGRGNGLLTLQEMGFRNLVGVDLSPRLLTQIPTSIERIVGDGTDLKFLPESIDVFIIQGGLHHLINLEDDLPLCLSGIHKTLKPEGKFFAIEPWETPFLKLIHILTKIPLLRRSIKKIDAFARMVEEEKTTYQRWLSSSDLIKKNVNNYFTTVVSTHSWGKWMYLGTK